MSRPIEPIPGDPERLTVPRHLAPDGPTDHYILRVVGDSMAAEAIRDGDYVVVRRTSTPSPGEMVVVLVGDDATIKRWYPEMDGVNVRLRPSNPEMSDVIVPIASAQAQGVVVGLMRKF